MTSTGQLSACAEPEQEGDQPGGDERQPDGVERPRSRHLLGRIVGDRPPPKPTTATANGTSIRISTRQFAASSTQPDSSGAISGPSMTTVPEMPTAVALLPSGNMPNAIDVASGTISPAHSPCRLRAAISQPRLSDAATAIGEQPEAGGSGEEHPLLAEAIGSPSRRQLRDAHRHQEHRDRPLGAGTEVGGDLRQGEDDERRVHQHDERGEDDRRHRGDRVAAGRSRRRRHASET